MIPTKIVIRSHDWRIKISYIYIALLSVSHSWLNESLSFWLSLSALSSLIADESHLYIWTWVDTKWFQSDILENGSTLCCSFQLFVKVTKSQLLLVSRRCIYYYCYSWSRNGDKNFSCTLYLALRSIINMSISFHRKILLILFFLCILSSSLSKYFCVGLCCFFCCSHCIECFSFIYFWTLDDSWYSN